MTKNNKEQRQLHTKRGVVVSDKMDKTIVVEVSRLAVNSKYRRKYKVTKRYKVHDEKEEYKVGDKIIIASVKPMSRHKSWKVVKKIK